MKAIVDPTLPRFGTDRIQASSPPNLVSVDDVLDLTITLSVGYKASAMFGTDVHSHAAYWHHHHIGGGLANLFLR